MNTTTRPASRRRFAHQARTYLLALLASAIVIYSMLLIRYFDAGIDLIVAHDLRSMAIRHAQQLQKGDNPRLPSRPDVLASYNYEDVPKFIRSTWAADDLEPSELYSLELQSPDPETNSDLAYLLSLPLHDGRTLFLARLVGPDDLHVEDEQLFHRLVLLILLPGAGFLVLGFLATHLLNRRLSGPTLALTQWAQTLEIGSSTGEVHPDFKYDELNIVADRLAKETSRLAEFIERERTFLRHASHELRTPIAVIRGTMEVLQKRGVADDVGERLGRIERANRSMQNLVETLLWLSREDEPNPEPVQIDLAKVVKTTIDDHSYLLRGKSVVVRADFESEHIRLYCASVPTQIILSNLIRNAFQHTIEGDVLVDVTSDHLMIESLEMLQMCRPDRTEIEEGLGLSLVRRLAARMHWQLNVVVDDRRVVWTWRLPKQTD